MTPDMDEATPVDRLPTPEELGAAAAAVVHRALHLPVTLATAESCTGGLLGHLLTDVAGVSGSFRGGWVVYANDLKMELGVPAATLQAHGAVSAAVARALAEAARRRAGADIGISTTGIAGPGGGSEAKPVGTLFIGIATGTTTAAHQVHVRQGDRQAIKRAFALQALQHLLSTVDAAGHRRATSP